jgi:hypothetical protein
MANNGSIQVMHTMGDFIKRVLKRVDGEMVEAR